MSSGVYEGGGLFSWVNAALRGTEALEAYCARKGYDDQAAAEIADFDAVLNGPSLWTRLVESVALPFKVEISLPQPACSVKNPTEEDQTVTEIFERKVEEDRAAKKLEDALFFAYQNAPEPVIIRQDEEDCDEVLNCLIHHVQVNGDEELDDLVYQAIRWKVVHSDQWQFS